MPFCITLGGFKKVSMAQASLTGVGTVYADYAPPSVSGLNDLEPSTLCHLHAICYIVNIYIHISYIIYMYVYIHTQTRHPRGFLWLVARDYCLLSRVSEVMAQAVSFTDTNPVLGRVSGDIMVTRVSG